MTMAILPATQAGISSRVAAGAVKSMTDLHASGHAGHDGDADLADAGDLADILASGGMARPLGGADELEVVVAVGECGKPHSHPPGRAGNRDRCHSRLSPGAKCSRREQWLPAGSDTLPGTQRAEQDNRRPRVSIARGRDMTRGDHPRIEPNRALPLSSMDTMTCISTRYSCREYLNKPVPQELLAELVDAGRRAPSGRKEEPVEYIVVTDQTSRDALAQLTSYGKFLTQAGACIVVIARPVTYYLEDGCAAAENILLAATAQGLQSCWIAGDKKPYAHQILGALCRAAALQARRHACHRLRQNGRATA